MRKIEITKVSYKDLQGATGLCHKTIIPLKFGRKRNSCSSIIENIHVVGHVTQVATNDLSPSTMPNRLSLPLVSAR